MYAKASPEEWERIAAVLKIMVFSKLEQEITLRRSNASENLQCPSDEDTPQKDHSIVPAVSPEVSFDALSAALNDFMAITDFEVFVFSTGL